MDLYSVEIAQRGFVHTKSFGVQPRMTSEKPRDVIVPVGNVQESDIALWFQLLETASSVLRCSKLAYNTKPISAASYGRKRSPVTYAQTYSLTEEDLKILDKYVGVYSSKFRYVKDRGEIYQDLVVELLRTDYLARFDSSKNSKAGFISRFTYNYFCKLFKVKGYAVNRATSFEDMVVEFVDNSKPDLDPISIRSLEKVAVFLDDEFPFTSGVRYKEVMYIEVVYAGEEANTGETIVWRSMSNIFRLTAMDFLQDEIAQVFRVSKGWISKQVDRIRSVEEVRNWAREQGAQLKMKKR